MIRYCPAIIALFAAVAGWHYLFYSSAAQRLGAIEPSPVNQRRSRLRKINGLVLLLLAGCFYSGFKIDPHLHPLVFVGIWTVVLILLCFSIAMAVADLRLTSRIRRKS